MTTQDPPANELTEDDQLTRLLESPVLVTANAIRAFVTLGLAEELDARPLKVSELAETASLDPDALKRLLAHLRAVGIVVQGTDSRWRLTDLGQRLTQRHPYSRAPEVIGGGVTARYEIALQHLDHSIRTGSAAYPHPHGRSLWEDMESDLTLAAAFDATMARHTRQLGHDLISSYPWSTVDHVVDLGGGNGSLLADLLAAQPSLHATLVEYSRTSERVGAALTGTEASSRCTIVEGSFFEAWPTNGDTYLLSWILHDWDDEEVATILERGQDALQDGDRLLVIERPLSDRLSDAAATALDLLMLGLFGGRERSHEDYEDLIANAGLQTVQWIPLTAGFEIAEIARNEDRSSLDPARRFSTPHLERESEGSHGR